MSSLLLCSRNDHALIQCEDSSVVGDPISDISELAVLTERWDEILIAPGSLGLFARICREQDFKIMAANVRQIKHEELIETRWTNILCVLNYQDTLNASMMVWSASEKKAIA